MAGRPRKPSALHIIEGTDRNDRMNQAEPIPTISVGEKPPKWLSLESRRVWRWLAPRLIAMRVLTDADRDAFGLGCDAMADYLAHRATILDHGSTYETTTMQHDTMIRPRPEVAMMADAWRRAERIFNAFGMTPSARSKVKAQAEEDIDPMEQFLAKGV